MPRIILYCDEDDYAAIQEEFARRQAQGRDLPDGESCLRGAMVGEIVRDLVEYRELWEAEH